MGDLQADIVLATYNGQRYLEEQLDSLLGQSVSNTRILIGDDGSLDGTLQLVDQYAVKLPGRVQTLPKDPGSKGACGNFNRLLMASDAPYVFLCDQDDVWDADKVHVALELLRELESVYGTDTPILVHTDLRVVDQNLAVTSDSFFEFQNLDAHASAFKQLLVQNMVTGCTVVVNRALLNKALPIPADAIMHDWWLALVAAAFGKIGFLNRATVSYRQHGANTVGAKGWTIALIGSRLKMLMSSSGAGSLLRPALVQVKAFVRCYKESLSAEQLASVSCMVQMPDQLGVSRVLAAGKAGLHKQGVMRTLGYYWALLIASFR